MSVKTADERRASANRKWQRLKSPARPLIYVGAGSCGRAAGATEVVRRLKDHIKQRKLGAKIVEVGCIGPCFMEPLVDIQMPKQPRISYSNVTPDFAVELLDAFHKNGKVPTRNLIGHFGEEDFNGTPRFFDHPMLEPQVRVVLRNCGIIDPEDIDHYLARDGYRGLEKALSIKPEKVIDVVKHAGLRGRGGAGFPTWQKWTFCRKTESDQRYLICNADEGDPGAFMNRSLIEGDPHALLEGMLIAAYAIGASKGFIYIRAEYPLAIERLKRAIPAMRKLGLLGDNILGSRFNFDLKIKEGAGAFVCGEETALIASIEGKRGMPRTRPPFPAVSGLWGKPTIINNVETLGTLPNILRNGAKWYAQFGTEKSRGTKTFSLVGKVKRTGLIEVPLGTTLGEVLYDIGGGIAADKAAKAVQTGGPSGGCLPAEKLGLRVDYESLAAAGSIMGSGGMIVMDEDTCVVDLAKYFLGFTQEESCGKCPPCRVGTRAMLTILDRITNGEADMSDLDRLERLAETINSGSLCGLGQTAANPVVSTLRYFRDEYEEHIRHKRCRAAVCKGLVGAPCHATCPIGTEAWRYVAHITRGEYEDAYRTIREANPFPSVCARVCSHPCEARCRSGTTGKRPIAIRALKRFVTDNVEPSVYTPKRVTCPSEVPHVAVVGSGPAGLTAAHYLSLSGHKVTVFESDDRPGGMLVSGIPSYRLSRETLGKEIDALLDENVTLKCNTALGYDMTVDDLFQDGFKAVFLAMGAHKSRKLNIEGEDITGVFPAIQFLKAFNLRGEKLATGKVGIIGGGDSAVDAAGVAIRQPGVESATIYYRRTREEMPALDWDIEAAFEEGVKLETMTSPASILTEGGRLAGIECVRNRQGDAEASGRRKPVPIPGSEFTVPLDTLIVTIGDVPDIEYISSMGVNVTDWGTLLVDPETLATSRPGVFAGGDVVTGPNTVVDAIAAGKKVAVMIARFIRGDDLQQPGVARLPSTYIQPAEVTPEEMADVERVELPMIPLDRRKESFDEVELTLSESDAVREARRCLRCDLEFTMPDEEEDESCLDVVGETV
ncbi:MAG: NADH-quinone oxidoreductase subunit NuoF [Phycisphaerae bacterium]|jgi:NADH-quinone oxidoreductase subunit F